MLEGLQALVGLSAAGATALCLDSCFSSWVVSLGGDFRIGVVLLPGFQP